MYQASARVREIFRQLNDTGTEDDYDLAKAKLKEHFEPQKNSRYVFKFREAKQETNETLDQFHTRLQSLAQTCSFADADFETEQQIRIAGSSSRIRKKALRDPTYVLKDILVDGRRDEQSTYQARDIESKESKLDNLNEVRSKQQCHFCGGSYPHSKGPCPAKGKECRKSGKRNHFAKVCRSKQQQFPSDKSKKREQNNKKHL